MIHWKQCIETAQKKDKAFARFCKSGVYRYLTKEQAKVFISLLVEYGARPKWQPVIRKVLADLNRIHGVKENETEKTPLPQADDQASARSGGGGDATVSMPPGAETAGSSAVTP